MNEDSAQGNGNTRPIPPWMAEIRQCFEAEWQAGQRPSIEALCASLPEPDRSVLLCDLLALEVRYRRRNGDTPTWEEYQQRFPAEAPNVLDLFIDTEPDGNTNAVTLGPSEPLAAPPGDQTQLSQTGAPPAVVPTRPKAVAGYEILEELGRGGMGVVYKARQLSLSRIVALKMIRAGDHAAPRELARFRTEAEAVARLQHPNIVQIYEIGEHKGEPFFSLEFVGGGSLSRLIHATPQPPRAAAELIETLARAVHVAHEAGIIHRDLKPANILLQEEQTTKDTKHTKEEKNHGETPRASTAEPQPSPSSSLRDSSVFRGFPTPKITDFGLAKRLDSQDGQTQSGEVMGTPSYMSPEQAQGNVRELGPAADIYALGAILYELLTGRPPFKGETVFDTLEQVCTREPVPPTRLQPHVQRDLETITLKCLQKQRDKRYASAADFADDVRRFLNQEPIIARPVGAWERGLKWARRRPAAALALAACAAALMGLVGTGIAVGLWRYTDLRAEYAQAQADQAEARAKEQEEREGRRLADLQVSCQGLILEGKEAFERRDWQQAEVKLSNALVMIRREPSLASFRDSTERQFTEATHRLNLRLARQEALDRAARFSRLNDEALFYLNRNVFTVAELAGPPRASENAARRALDVVGLRLNDETGPLLDAYEAEEKRQLRLGCYEALLILAEAVARPVAGQPPAEQKKRAAEALRILHRAELLGFDTRIAHLRRARYLTLQAEEPGARKEAAQAAKVTPVLALDLFLLGNDAWFANRRPEAREYFRKTLDVQPDHFWAQYFMAVSNLSNHDRLEARSNLTVCSKQQPNFIWIYVLRGSINTELRDYSAAEADFGKAFQLLDRHPDADARYVTSINRGVMQAQRARNRKPDDPLRRRDLDQAIADFQQAALLKPDYYLAPMQLGFAFRVRGERDRAREELSRAITLYRPQATSAGSDPRLALLYRERAYTAREQNDLPAARQDFEQAIHLEPPGSRTLAEDHLERAVLLYRTQQLPEAVKACDAALQVDPRYDAAHRVRAEVLLALKQYDEAVRSFDRFLELEDAKEPEARKQPLVRALVALALASARLGRGADAVDDYTRALALKPNDATTRARRGWAYLMNDAPKLALRDFEEVVHLDPANGDAHSGRGAALVRLGRNHAAVEAVEESLRRGTGTSRLFYTAARTYAQAVGHMDTDPRQRSYQALETRSRYQDRALELLRAALDRTPPRERPRFWQDYIEADPALESIRHSPAFARLALENARLSKRWTTNRS
jgi:serine/threonine protein kinase/tetratricopeptide (TPR) repeat protein